MARKFSSKTKTNRKNVTGKGGERIDIYEKVTAQVIESLEKGVKPWTQPWNAAHVAGPVSKPLRHNGQAYAGINILMLWVSAMERGFSAPIWMTYRQAQELGGQVRKGEKGSPVVYAGAIEKTEEDDKTGEEIERVIPFLKSYTVFNVQQIDGLPEHFTAKAEKTGDPEARIAEAERFFEATGAEIAHGGDRAFYAPGPDRMQMPEFEDFRDAGSYYATRAHETVHWTGHKKRLNRDFGREKWGDAGYAREELVAELGAAFVCADLGIELEDREDHASYIASWLTVLKNDKRAIFQAAAHAQRAAEFLHGLQIHEAAA